MLGTCLLASKCIDSSRTPLRPSVHTPAVLLSILALRDSKCSGDPKTVLRVRYAQCRWSGELIPVSALNIAPAYLRAYRFDFSCGAASGNFLGVRKRNYSHRSKKFATVIFFTMVAWWYSAQIMAASSSRNGKVVIVHGFPTPVRALYNGTYLNILW